MSTPSRHVLLRPATVDRLKAYTGPSASFDDVIRELMTALPPEDVSERIIRRHRRRLATRSGRPWREVRKALGDG